MIHSERLCVLNEAPVRQGRYVLYWMQQAVRTTDNHALEFAIREANALALPVVVVFGLTEQYPEANARHYAFLLEGLRDVQEGLKARGIPMLILRQSPEQAALQLASEAALLVTDRGYLRIQKAWRATVAENAPCRVVQVESDVIVPLETASEKEEFAARTLRPKIHRLLETYLVPLETTVLTRRHPTPDARTPPLWEEWGILPELASLEVDRTVQPSPDFRGGEQEALRRLDEFAMHGLKDYATKRNDPSLNGVSHLSPYLHYGQISPLTIALRLLASPYVESRDAYLEELIVRRELSMNFVYYNPRYDTYEGLPDWAKKTLATHQDDPREFLYSRKELEQAQTHDPYWNAAQREMVVTGKMHNYMRMYWGKKILEWTATPEEAFATTLYLNNRYELDGRDANSFTGVAWCFGKHDRPWGERSVFGMVRYMNAAGLKRKFDMETYVRNVQARTDLA